MTDNEQLRRDIETLSRAALTCSVCNGRRKLPDEHWAGGYPRAWVSCWACGGQVVASDNKEPSDGQ